MKDRLIELLKEIREHPEKTCADWDAISCDGCRYDLGGVECDVVARFADYLIANGVIVPPCKVGDEVYCIIAKGGLSGGLIFTGHIIKRKVDKLIFDGKRWEMMSDRIYPDFKDGNGLIYAYFGDLVFVGEDEAKNRLKEILAIGDRRIRK